LSQEAELSAAPRLLDQVRAALRGRLVSGDARYCQQALCQQIRTAGGDYLFAVRSPSTPTSPACWRMWRGCGLVVVNLWLKVHHRMAAKVHQLVMAKLHQAA
jgi:hypothetical protein